MNISQKREESKRLLKRYKKHIVSTLQTLKRNRIKICNSYDNSALHDFRVAVRRLLCIDSILKKTADFEMPKDSKIALKFSHKEGSELRDLEEFLSSFPGFKPKYAEQKNISQIAFIKSVDMPLIEFKILKQYEPLYKLLRKEPTSLLQIRGLAFDTLIRSLAKTSKQLSSAFEDGDGIDFDYLHKMRKKCKKHRYQSEFIFLGENEASLICKRLQDRLGHSNDYRVWLEYAKGEERVLGEISTSLASALDEAKKEALIFSSKGYCDSLKKELKERFEIF